MRCWISNEFLGNTNVLILNQMFAYHDSITCLLLLSLTLKIHMKFKFNILSSDGLNSISYLCVIILASLSCEEEFKLSIQKRLTVSGPFKEHKKLGQLCFCWYSFLLQPLQPTAFTQWLLPNEYALNIYKSNKKEPFSLKKVKISRTLWIIISKLSSVDDLEAQKLKSDAWGSFCLIRSKPCPKPSTASAGFSCLCHLREFWWAGLSADWASSTSAPSLACSLPWASTFAFLVLSFSSFFMLWSLSHYFSLISYFPNFFLFLC